MSAFRVACAVSLALAVISPAHADSRRLTIFNNTEAPIAAVQVRAPGQVRWQDNLLVQRTIGVARSEVVQIATPPCLYDFFVTFDDGHRRIIQHIDVCGKASLYINGS